MLIDKILNFLSTVNVEILAETIIDLLEAIFIVIPVLLCVAASIIGPFLGFLMFMGALVIDSITEIIDLIKKVFSFIKN